ncbi:MAG: hypothetical protein IKC87_03050 [Clostridia bacterium]|nr:hypothetical protein [Clostridia bacterium]
MNKNKENSTVSAPYRTHSLEKITAPVKSTKEPKASRITSGGDLRSGKK